MGPHSLKKNMGPVGDLQSAEHSLGHVFKHRKFLELALTHSSAAHERKGSASKDNEQLEFLGDSVLGFVVSDYLYHHFHHLNEGELSKLRAHLVSSANLFKLARQLGLGDYLILGKGEEKTGGRKKQAVLADAFEAVVAAIFLDGGLPAARRFIHKVLSADLQAAVDGRLASPDFKSQLQEKLQALRIPNAEYSVVREIGPDHRKSFWVELRINGKKLSEGHGDTKKLAEQEAARVALGTRLQPPLVEPRSSTQGG
ncbi:MAG: ribonuclease III [Terriglobia bacterium]